MGQDANKKANYNSINLKKKVCQQKREAPLFHFVNVTKVLLLSRRVRKRGREDSRYTEGILKAWCQEALTLDDPRGTRG